MKHLYTFLLACLVGAAACAQGKSQTPPLAGQFKKLIADAASNFVSFRGEKVKDDNTDTIYTSRINLDGTTENQVLHLGSGHSYLAKIRETKDPKVAKTLVESWKKKLTDILGPDFDVVADNQAGDDSVLTGYLLTSDQLSISIHSIKYNNEETINVYLIIMNL